MTKEQQCNNEEQQETTKKQWGFLIQEPWRKKITSLVWPICHDMSLGRESQFYSWTQSQKHFQTFLCWFTGRTFFSSLPGQTKHHSTGVQHPSRLSLWWIGAPSCLLQPDCHKITSVNVSSTPQLLSTVPAKIKNIPNQTTIKTI